MDQIVDTGVESIATEAKPEVSIEVKPDVVGNKKEEVKETVVDYTKPPEKELGRLVRSLGEKCPDCHSALQVRARKSTQLVLGVENTFEVTYKYCPKCHHESGMEQKKRELRADRTAQNDETGGKNGHKKRSRTGGFAGETDIRGPRKYNSRSPKSV